MFGEIGGVGYWEVPYIGVGAGLKVCLDRDRNNGRCS